MYTNNLGIIKLIRLIKTALSTKVDKIPNKQLSTNDYTTDEKNKLSGIETGANKTIVDASLSGSSTNPVQNKAVNTAINNKANKSTTLAGYGITDAYTKTEIDTKLSTALKYKGTVAKYTSLPAAANNGDVYNITAAGGTDANGTLIKAGDNVAYNGNGWDVLAGTVDLSNYFSADDVISNDEIDTICV